MWAHEHCGHVAHVAKSDDNVEVDLDTLTSALQSPGRGAGHWAGLVTCPTLCYGMRVIRETRAGMTGNWSHSAAEERSYFYNLHNQTDTPHTQIIQVSTFGRLT